MESSESGQVLPQCCLMHWRPISQSCCQHAHGMVADFSSYLHGQEAGVLTAVVPDVCVLSKARLLILS